MTALEAIALAIVALFVVGRARLGDARGFLRMRRLAGERVEECCAEGVHVRSEILEPLLKLFWGNIEWGRPEFTLLVPRLIRWDGEAKIHDFCHVLCAEQDVTRLDVTMYQADPMGGVETFRDVDAEDRKSTRLNSSHT